MEQFNALMKMFSLVLHQEKLVYYEEDALTKEYYFKYDESSCLEQLTRFKTGLSEILRRLNVIF